MEKNCNRDCNKGILKEFEIQFGTDLQNAKFSRNERFLIYLVSEKEEGLIGGSYRYKLVIYDIDNNDERARISLESKPRDYICFDDGGSNYVIAYFPNDIHLWNINSGENCGHLGLRVPNSLVTQIHDFVLSDNETYVGYVATDKTKTLSNASFCRIFNIKDGLKIYESKHGHYGNNVSALCISPDNKYVVKAFGRGNSVIVLETLKFTEENKLIRQGEIRINNILYSNKIDCVSFDPDGNKIYLTNKNLVIIHDFVNKKTERCLIPYAQSPSSGIDLEFNYNGDLLLTKSNLGFKLYDVETGQLKVDINKEIDDPSKGLNVISASFSPYNNYLLLCFNNGIIRNVDIDSMGRDEEFSIESRQEENGFLIYRERKVTLEVTAAIIVMSLFLAVYLIWWFFTK